jgi:hypothetical protein
MGGDCFDQLNIVFLCFTAKVKNGTATWEERGWDGDGERQKLLM